MPLRYCHIKIKSKSYAEPTGAANSEVIIEDIDYSINKTGINMVMIDKETGEVADSVNINTYSDASILAKVCQAIRAIPQSLIEEMAG